MLFTTANFKYRGGNVTRMLAPISAVPLWSFSRLEDRVDSEIEPVSQKQQPKTVR